MEIRSMEDRVVVIVKEFFQELSDLNPFDKELMDFRFRIRAKLVELTSAYSTDPDLACKTLNLALEGIEKVLREEINKVDLDSEDHIIRTVQTLNALNEVLKEMLSDDRVKDKRKLSSLTGMIGGAVEKLKGEYKNRHGGLVKSIKRLLGMGPSL